MSRTQDRSGTKTTVIPDAKFRLGRYGRPNKMRLTKRNEQVWRKR